MDISKKYILKWKFINESYLLLSLKYIPASIYSYHIITFKSGIWFWQRLVEWVSEWLCLTHWRLVTPFGDIDLGQHWPCCLTASSHYLNQCWLISKVLWHSSEGIIMRRSEDTNQQNKTENYIFRIALRSPRGQWVNSLSHTADNEIHVTHISHVVINYTLE